MLRRRILSKAGDMDLYLLSTFAVLSIADLKWRSIPSIEIIFFGAAVVSLADNTWAAAAAILIVLWGALTSVTGWVTLPAWFVPSAWPTLLVAFGVRKRMIGRGDLFAAGAMTCLLPWQGMIISFLTLEVWRRWWLARGHGGPIPALPGLFLGVLAYSVIKPFIPA